MPRIGNGAGSIRWRGSRGEISQRKRDGECVSGNVILIDVSLVNACECDQLKVNGSPLRFSCRLRGIQCGQRRRRTLTQTREATRTLKFDRPRHFFNLSRDASTSRSAALRPGHSRPTIPSHHAPDLSLLLSRSGCHALCPSVTSKALISSRFSLL